MDRAPSTYGAPAADELLARDVAGDVGDMTASPMRRYLTARTAFFDRLVVESIDAGVRQVVVLAAGYDGRSLRYSHPDVEWFEVDHPATQADKLARLGRLGVAAPRVHFVAVDFDHEAAGEELVGSGLVDAAPALVLCEGLAVYLDEAVLLRLLGGVRAVVADGSVLAISLSTDSPADADPSSSDAHRQRVERFTTAVGLVGEPVRSRTTVDDAAALLPSVGWALDRRGVAGCATFRTAAAARRVDDREFMLE